MRFLTAILAFQLIAAPALAQTESPPRPQKNRLIVGLIERVVIFPGKFMLHGKIDTGARTSSINAQNIDHFKRSGVRYVRFSVTNRENKTITLERRVVRWVRIKEIGYISQRRPVIKLGLCVGNVFRNTEVSLADRTGFNYQILVGRKFTNQRIIVDPAREYVVEPSCTGPGHAGVPKELSKGPSPGPNQTK